MEAVRNKLVFLVEDNELYSLMLDYTLSNDSMVKFMCFKTGEECLKNLHLNPMLVILDYWLPGINGLETLKKIRAYRSKIPVIILTQDRDVEIATKLLNEGVKDYFNKERESVAEIKKIIDSELKKLIEKEEKQVLGMKAIVFVFCLIALIIVIIYINDYEKGT